MKEISKLMTIGTMSDQFIQIIEFVNKKLIEKKVNAAKISIKSIAFQVECTNGKIVDINLNSKPIPGEINKYYKYNDL